MGKNIAVLDAQGNHYEATYPRRAKGLVKKGWARFINETTICLTARPEYTEENQMNMEDIANNINNTAEISADSKADMQYIMRKIDQILADTQYLKDAVTQFNAAGDGAGVGLGAMVEAREKTNQEMIALLNKMLDFTSEPPVISSREKLKIMFDFMSMKNLDDDNNSADILRQIIEKIKYL